MAALPNQPAVSLDEYLHTAYDPDVEFVDGVLVERKMGDWLHSLVQSNIIFVLRTRYPRLKVVPELRSNTAANRYRLPDVTVLLAAPVTRYLTDAALIVIEILSAGDEMGEMLEKLAEYEAKGVGHIWLIDPRHRRMFSYNGGNLLISSDRLVCDSPVEVVLTANEVLAE